MEEPSATSEDEKPEMLHRSVPAVPGRALLELQDLKSPQNDQLSCDVEEDLPTVVARNHGQLMEKLRQHDTLLHQILAKRGPFSGFSSLAPSTPELKKDGLDFDTDAASPVESATSRSTRHSQRRRPSGGSFTPTLFTSYTKHEMDAKAGASEVHGHAVRRKFASMRAEVSPDVTSERPNQSRTALEKMVRSSYFDAFFTCVVIANTMFIGFDVQYTISNNGVQPVVLFVGNYIFSGFFVAELVLRLCVEGKRLYCGEDWMWGWLDTFIVLTAMWDVVVDILVAVQGSASGALADMSGLRTLRIIRLTRIVKAVRLMRIFRFVMALRMLVASIVNTLKSLFWALVLLILIVYVFGVVFAQATSDYLLDTDLSSVMLEDQRAYLQARFGSVVDAMLSLFMSITDGISYHQLLSPLAQMSQLWIFVFLFYISFSYFAVLNVVTGVFCHSAIESAQNDHAAVVQSILENKESHMRKLRQLFSKFNSESSIADEDEAIITFPMFEEKIGTAAVREYFESLNLDVWDAWSFFKLLDLDQGGAVSVDEFLMGCLRLRGAARAMDVGKLLHDQAWLIKSQSHFQAFAEVELRDLKTQVGMVVDVIQGEGMTTRRAASSASSTESKQPPNC